MARFPPLESCIIKKLAKFSNVEKYHQKDTWILFKLNEDNKIRHLTTANYLFVYITNKSLLDRIVDNFRCVKSGILHIEVA